MNSTEEIRLQIQHAKLEMQHLEPGSDDHEKRAKLVRELEKILAGMI